MHPEGLCAITLIGLFASLSMAYGMEGYHGD